MMIIYIVFLQRFASFCIHAIVIVQAMSIDCFAVSINCEIILYSLQDHDAFKEEFSIPLLACQWYVMEIIMSILYLQRGLIRIRIRVLA